MVQKLDPAGLASFKELQMTNSIMPGALAQLLIEKGTITQKEFISKLKQIQAEYKARQND